MSRSTAMSSYVSRVRWMFMIVELKLYGFCIAVAAILPLPLSSYQYPPHIILPPPI